MSRIFREIERLKLLIYNKYNLSRCCSFFLSFDPSFYIFLYNFSMIIYHLYIYLDKEKD